MTITEFASSRNEQTQTISAFIKRHPEKFEGHTKKVGKTVELDENAIDILDKQYPLPKPVTVINGVDPEEYEKILQDLKELQKKYDAAIENIAKIQTERLAEKELIGKAEAQQLLLENTEKQLNDEKEEKEKLQAEIDRLKNRTFWERVLNK